MNERKRRKEGRMDGRKECGCNTFEVKKNGTKME